MISMNGNRALSLQSGRARVWDVRSGALLDTEQFPTEGGGDFQLALSATGSTALVVRAQGDVLVWRPHAPQRSHRFPEMLSDGVSCRAATPTPWTSRFEVGCEGADGFEDIRIDLTANGYQATSDPVLYGARGAGAGNMHGLPEPMLNGPSFAQRSAHAARFYRDLVTRGETRTEAAVLTGQGATVRLLPNGRIVVTAQDGREREIVFGGLNSAELSPDRRAIFMAGANGDARIYNLNQIAVSPIAIGRFADYERSQPRGPVFSPDGRYVVAMRSVDSEVLVIDTETKRSFVLSTYEASDEMFAGVRALNGVDRVLFSQGRIFASTTGGRIIHAWTPANPSQREELSVAANAELVQRIGQYGLELSSLREHEPSSPNGRFIIRTGTAGEVLLQSRESGFTMARFEPIQNSPLRAAVFSADGTRLAVLSAQGDIAVWDLSSLDQTFDEGAAWVCQNLLTRAGLRHFSDSDIARDPLLGERGVDARLDLCAS
ncbi:MAG TPA: WD40 repeat domain-containing protein [Candidatus Binatia bacterium]|nr:WD40 repeat domain-containing protein [Candidatus Binatia bacterium]